MICYFGTVNESGVYKDRANRSALGRRGLEGPPDIHNATICCRFVQTEFNLSDRRQYSGISGSNFANNYWELRLPVIESRARVGDPDGLSGNSNSRSTSRVKRTFGV
jgi:hypothetical protein